MKEKEHKFPKLIDEKTPTWNGESSSEQVAVRSVWLSRFEKVFVVCLCKSVLRKLVMLQKECGVNERERCVNC